MTFHSMSDTIFCSFQGECNCTCHIEYGICINQSISRLTLGNPSGTIQISDPTQYCYSASATNVGNTIIVHGTFYSRISSSIQEQNDSRMIYRNIHLTVTYALASTVVVSLIAILFVVTVSCIYVRMRLRKKNTIMEFTSPIYDDLEDVKETTIYADKNVAYSTPWLHRQ